MRFVSTTEARPDIPAEDAGGANPIGWLWLRFLGLGGLLAVTGWMLGRAGETIAVETALTETAMGVLLTGWLPL